MKQFKYEMHCHTSDVSHCGKIPASEVVRNYIELGYDGIIVTDHFSRRSIGRLKNASWDEKIDFFLSGYQSAVDTAKKLNPEFSVLLGMELRLDIHDVNDFLVYGIDEPFLRASEHILMMDFESLSKYLHENELLIVQAHPFREDMVIMDWNLLDGVEVYNGNCDHDSSNSIADAWADLHHLLKTSGSDYHGTFGMTPGGICTNVPIRTNEDLMNILRTGNYTLLKEGE